MGTYKVMKDSMKNWSTFPYIVYGPDGYVITVTSTLWGAKRAIRKHKLAKVVGLVYEEETID